MWITFQWVRALFTPTKRSAAGTARHPYALHHPEPVAHFALSTGAFSDPPVKLFDHTSTIIQSLWQDSIISSLLLLHCRSGCTRRRRYSSSWRRRGRSSSRAAWWCGSRRCCCCPRCCTTTPGTPRWSCGTWWSWCARACRTRSRSSCSSTASAGGSTSASSGCRTSRPSDTLYIGIWLTD